MTFPTWLHNVVYQLNIYFFIFRKWLIVLLDKTLIHWLGLCRALWSCIETAIWTFNPLATIEVHYMEKNPGMFSSKKTLFLCDWRQKDMNNNMNILNHMGWANYQDIFILEVNLSFTMHSCTTNKSRYSWGRKSCNLLFFSAVTSSKIFILLSLSHDSS